jgi:uncharacterized protein (TIGR02284 family)
MESQHLVNQLNDLIETAKDGEYGFTRCAEHARSEAIRALFTRRAQDCHAAAAELQNIVRDYGGRPDDGGRASGALHRGWVAVLGTIAGDSDKRMLEEAERGEDSALARYRKVLRDEALPPLVRSIIERQMDGAQRNHDQVRNLRDVARAAA